MHTTCFLLQSTCRLYGFVFKARADMVKAELPVHDNNLLTQLNKTFSIANLARYSLTCLFNLFYGV
jgi:hypothetical protein